VSSDQKSPEEPLPQPGSRSAQETQVAIKAQ
jgi:hypothetical protein